MKSGQKLFFFHLVFREKERLILEKDIERCIRQTSRMGKRVHQVMEENRTRDKEGSKAGA